MARSRGPLFPELGFLPRRRRRRRRRRHRRARERRAIITAISVSGIFQPFFPSTPSAAPRSRLYSGDTAADVRSTTTIATRSGRKMRSLCEGAKTFRRKMDSLRGELCRDKKKKRSGSHTTLKKNFSCSLRMCVGVSRVSFCLSGFVWICLDLYRRGCVLGRSSVFIMYRQEQIYGNLYISCIIP